MRESPATLSPLLHNSSEHHLAVWLCCIFGSDGLLLLLLTCLLRTWRRTTSLLSLLPSCGGQAPSRLVLQHTEVRYVSSSEPEDNLPLRYFTEAMMLSVCLWILIPETRGLSASSILLTGAGCRSKFRRDARPAPFSLLANVSRCGHLAFRRRLTVSRVNEVFFI